MGASANPSTPLSMAYSCHTSGMYLSSIAFLAARGMVNIGETGKRLEINEHDDICKKIPLRKSVVADVHGITTTQSSGKSPQC